MPLLKSLCIFTERLRYQQSELEKSKDRDRHNMREINKLQDSISVLEKVG